MAIPVSLQDVVDQMDLISDDMVTYINRKSGELITLTNEDISLAEENGNSCSIPEWQRDLVDKTRQALTSNVTSFLPFIGNLLDKIPALTGFYSILPSCHPITSFNQIKIISYSKSLYPALIQSRFIIG